MSKKRIVLRADGNSRTGLGHVYRLMALTEMLQDVFDCTFILNKPEAFVLDAIKEKGANPVAIHTDYSYKPSNEHRTGDEMPFDIAEFIDGKEIVVTDGYLFGEKYQLAVKTIGSKLVCIDDLAAHRFFADVVINHAPGIKSSAYNVLPDAQLLTGLDYALIRQAFLKPLAGRNTRNNAFICVGGADYNWHTGKILDLISDKDELELIHILCSPAFDPALIARLREKESQSNRIRLHFNLDADSLVRVLDDCTHAFVSASTILMESYARGLRCFTGYYVENQRFLYNGFTRDRLAAGLGDLESLSQDDIDRTLESQDSIKPIKHSLISDQHIRRVFHALAKKIG